MHRGQRAFILRRPRSKASYSVVLLVDDSRLPKVSRAAYLVFAPEGDSMIVMIVVICHWTLPPFVDAKIPPDRSSCFTYVRVGEI